jgi:hypothetical protein
LKRRSATKRSPTPPESTFFTDRDLGKIFPALLREGGLLVERYVDHFAERNVADQEWIAFAARQKWVPVSHDKNIKWDPVAVRTVMEEGGRLFILRGKQLTGPEKARLFLEAGTKVKNLLTHQGGNAFIATVRRAVLQGGVFRVEVKLSLTYSEWRRGRLVAGAESEEPDL